MPIFSYICPVGHKLEFFKFRADEKEPSRCKKCRKKLAKIICGTNWQYVRGKNKNWPIGTSEKGEE